MQNGRRGLHLVSKPLALNATGSPAVRAISAIAATSLQARRNRSSDGEQQHGPTAERPVGRAERPLAGRDGGRPAGESLRWPVNASPCVVRIGVQPLRTRRWAGAADGCEASGCPTPFCAGFSLHVVARRRWRRPMCRPRRCRSIQPKWRYCSNSRQQCRSWRRGTSLRRKMLRVAGQMTVGSRERVGDAWSLSGRATFYWARA